MWRIAVRGDAFVMELELELSEMSCVACLPAGHVLSYKTRSSN
jgi:hypothetical protein